MDFAKGQRVQVRAGNGRWDNATVRFISYRITPPGQTRPDRAVVNYVSVQRDIDPRGFEAQYEPERVRPIGQ